MYSGERMSYYYLATTWGLKKTIILHFKENNLKIYVYLHFWQIVRLWPVRLTYSYDNATFFTATFWGEFVLESDDETVKDDTTVDREGHGQKFIRGKHLVVLRRAERSPQNTQAVLKHWSPIHVLFTSYPNFLLRFSSRSQCFCVINFSLHSCVYCPSSMKLAINNYSILFFFPWVNLALERTTFFSVQKYIRIIRGHFIDSFSPLTNSWIDATSLF